MRTFKRLRILLWAYWALLIVRAVQLVGSLHFWFEMLGRGWWFFGDASGYQTDKVLGQVYYFFQFVLYGLIAEALLYLAFGGSGSDQVLLDIRDGIKSLWYGLFSQSSESSNKES